MKLCTVTIARLLQQCAWDAVQEIRKLRKQAATQPATPNQAATQGAAE